MTLVIEDENRERVRKECHKSKDGTIMPKKKTSSIADRVAEPHYLRKPEEEILHMTKHETKTTIIARYGMLECGENYKGSLKQQCTECNCADDENHRLNHCIKWREKNLYDKEEKMDFKWIYSKDIDKLRSIISSINTVWNTQNAHGTMRTE